VAVGQRVTAESRAAETTEQRESRLKKATTTAESRETETAQQPRERLE
jgi:hypothetical protein